LFVDNPPNDLIAIEDQLAVRPDPEVRQPLLMKEPIPYGPRRTPDQLRYLFHVERLA
jgi:hypothetical protein